MNMQKQINESYMRRINNTRGADTKVTDCDNHILMRLIKKIYFEKLRCFFFFFTGSYLVNVGFLSVSSIFHLFHPVKRQRQAEEDEQAARQRRHPAGGDSRVSVPPCEGAMRGDSPSKQEAGGGQADRGRSQSPRRDGAKENIPG